MGIDSGNRLMKLKRIKQCDQTPKQIADEMYRLSKAIEQAKKSPVGDTGPITGGGKK